jgi:hypothetical protein
MTTSQDADSQGTSDDDCSRIVSQFERDWESSLQGGEPPTFEKFLRGVPKTTVRLFCKRSKKSIERFADC